MLSNLVFDHVFPELAWAIAAAAPDAPLADVRDATLTLLYRLLFVLYAEDLTGTRPRPAWVVRAVTLSSPALLTRFIGCPLALAPFSFIPTWLVILPSSSTVRPARPGPRHGRIQTCAHWPDPTEPARIGFLSFRPLHGRGWRATVQSQLRLTDA